MKAEIFQVGKISLLPLYKDVYTQLSIWFTPLLPGNSEILAT